MAIALVQSVGRNGFQGVQTHTTGTLGSSPTVGDVLVLFVQCQDSGTGRVFTGPSGWTEAVQYTNGTSNQSLAVYYRVVQSGDGTSYTVTWTNDSFFSRSSLWEYSGVDTTTPIDVLGTIVDAFTATWSANAITIASANALDMVFVYAVSGSETIDQAGYADARPSGGLVAFTKSLGTGSTGARTGTDSNGYVITFSLALRPGDSAAPATKIQFINAGAQTASNSSPQSPALPTNHAAGDLLLLFCIQASASGITFGPPAGWVSIGRNSNATRSMTIEVFAKIDNGSESAPSTTCSSAAGGWATQIGCWRNVDDGVISDTAAILSDAAAAATFQPTGITIGTPNAWVISFVGSKDDNALNFNTANGYTARMSGASYDDTAGNGSDYSVGVADQEFSTTGAKTCPTWNQSTNGNDAWVALTLALRPKTLVWGGRPDGRAGQTLMTQLLAT